MANAAPQLPHGCPHVLVPPVNPTASSLSPSTPVQTSVLSRCRWCGRGNTSGAERTAASCWAPRQAAEQSPRG